MDVEQFEQVSWLVPVELAEFIRQAAAIFQEDENEVASMVLSIGCAKYPYLAHSPACHCPRCGCQEHGYVETCRFCDGQPCRTPSYCEGMGGCECDVRECLQHGCDHLDQDAAGN